MRTRLLILIAMRALVHAQGPPGAQDADDPPGRAARLSYLSGTVSFQPGGVEDWVPATLNRPITTGDRLWTEPGARAELHLGSAALRLNGKTNFAFLNLRDEMTQVQISLGSLSVRLRRLADQEAFEVDTPQVAFSLLRPGEYRIDVNDQGDATIITVLGGEGEATGEGQAFTIHPREQVRITGTGADGGQPTYDRRNAPPPDSFDLWCEDRDRREDRSQSARYVSRDMPGYADLDEYGGWRQYPEYGAVWIPGGVPPGWAPYHYGHWAWIAPWGWTWVDDAPWGYAPFHYGRWAFIAGGWGWIPGPIAVRPVYAPALVAWVGGPRFSVALSIGGGPAVGWFPLGFGEVWVPSYRASPRYFNQVNVSNTVVNNVQVTNVYNNVYVNKNVNVTNVNYVNQRVNGAVAAVPQSAMVSGRPVSQAGVRVPPGAAASAEFQASAPVAPERGAVLGGRAPVSAVPPAAAMNRQVVARTAPPPPPVPFSQQQSALRSNPGRPVDSSALSQIQNSQPATRQLVRPAGRAGFAGRQGGISGGGNPNVSTQAPPLPPPQQQQPQFERRTITPPPPQQPAQTPQFERRGAPQPSQQQPPQPPQFERRNNPPPAPPPQQPPQQQPQFERRGAPPPQQEAPRPPQVERRSPPPETNRPAQVERQGQRPVEGKQERREGKREERKQ
jgi:hypothetical protein